MAKDETKSVELDLSKSVDQAFAEAPVLFVDGIHGLLVNEETVRFNFVQDRAFSTASTDDTPVGRVVCARIVMSKTTFLNIADWMANQVAVTRPEAEGEDAE
ncbi:MAG: hypothetical protein P1U84_05055 [Parvibaculaceae bacterium]|nr:hypothetical protein [Parvibaculaceae bacterium]